MFTRPESVAAAARRKALDRRKPARSAAAPGQLTPEASGITINRS